MKPRIRLVISPSRARRLQLYDVLRRSRGAYPQSQCLRKKWVRARLRLGNRKPMVRIGCQRDITFPRTLREAGIHGDLA